MGVADVISLEAVRTRLGRAWRRLGVLLFP